MFRNTALDPVAEAGIYKKINEIAGDKTAVYINSPLFSCKEAVNFSVSIEEKSFW